MEENKSEIIYVVEKNFIPRGGFDPHNIHPYGTPWVEGSGTGYGYQQYQPFSNQMNVNGYNVPVWAIIGMVALIGIGIVVYIKK